MQTWMREKDKIENDNQRRGNNKLRALIWSPSFIILDVFLKEEVDKGKQVFMLQ